MLAKIKKISLAPKKKKNEEKTEIHKTEKRIIWVEKFSFKIWQQISSY